jgi:hypothetical protein
MTENQLLWRVPGILRQYVNTPESRAWLEDFDACQFEKRLALETGNRPDCTHFWSIPSKNGWQECLWCYARRKAP